MITFPKYFCAYHFQLFIFFINSSTILTTLTSQFTRHIRSTAY